MNSFYLVDFLHDDFLNHKYCVKSHYCNFNFINTISFKRNDQHDLIISYFTIDGSRQTSLYAYIESLY